MSLQTTLSQTRVLWISFIATILLTIAFQVAVPVWDLILLDAIADPAEVRAALAAMSPEQHTIHAWVTATLDVAYPVAYGALFIGSGYRFYGRYGWLVALPAIVLVPVDLVEGVVQVLALTGIADWIDSKAYITPLKTGLFLVGIVTTIGGWVIWLVNRIRTG